MRCSLYPAKKNAYECIFYGTFIGPQPLNILPVGTPVTYWGVIQTTTVSVAAKVVMELTENGKVIGTPVK